jgi:hypothetical protein
MSSFVGTSVELVPIPDLSPNDMLRFHGKYEHVGCGLEGQTNQDTVHFTFDLTDHYRREAGESANRIAKEYGVVSSTIDRALSGETWNHL